MVEVRPKHEEVQLMSIVIEFHDNPWTVLGMFISRDLDNPNGRGFRQLNVRNRDEPPGWELYGIDRQVVDDPSDPAVLEADRLTRVLTIPSGEVARREQVARGVIANHRLSGFADDLPWQRQMFRFARGEITDDELNLIAHHSTLPNPDPNPDPNPNPDDVKGVPESAMPRAWRNAVHTRHKQHL